MCTIKLGNEVTFCCGEQFCHAIAMGFNGEKMDVAVINGQNKITRTSVDKKKLNLSTSNLRPELQEYYKKHKQ